MVAHRYDPGQGKWKLTRISKDLIRERGGQMPLYELLEALKKEGYHPEAARAIIPRLGLVVDDDGLVRVR